VIGIGAAFAVSEVGTCVTSWLPLTNCGASGIAPQKMTEPPEKPEPVTVSVKAELPALAIAGDRLPRTGT
jgi:hypothetical protein